MNKKTVFFTLTFTVLPLVGYLSSAKAEEPTSATEAITAQAIQTPGDIYRGTVFGAEKKNYQGDILGDRKAPTKKYVYDTSLIRAIKLDDADRVRTLMYAHVNVNEKNYAGITPLTVAAEKGNMDIIKMLVEDGKAEVNDKSSYGVTPLIAAAAAGQGTVIEYLVAHGADVTAKDDMGKTALLYAVNFDAPKAVESLIKLDNKSVNLPDNNGNSPLIYAAQKGLTNNVKVLLAQGASVNYRNPVSGLSALDTAAAEGHTQIVRMLLKNPETDVNLQDQSGRTPIFYAVDQNQPDALRALLAAGADVNAQDLTGTTSLMLAAAKNHTDCFNLLMKQKNIQPFMKDLQGRSALIYSAYAHDTYPAQKLLSAGANINEQDASGNTPLLTAIKAKNNKLAMFFVQQKADLSIANNAGENAFTLTDQFLPGSSVASILDIKRAGAQQQMLQVQAQKLAEVRSLEEELAQEENEVSQLAAQKEAQARAKVEQEYQDLAAQLEQDPELLQLQQQWEAAKAKKEAALKRLKEQRLAEELGVTTQNAQAQANQQADQIEAAAAQAKADAEKAAAQAKADAEKAAEQAKAEAEKAKQASQAKAAAARQKAKQTQQTAKAKAASTRSAVNEFIPKASVAPEEINMADFLKN